MDQIQVGLEASAKERATAEKSAANVGSGLLDVYATPSLIAFMEKTSSELIQPFLSHADTSVGGLVNIRHLKPTAIGDEITCKASVREVKGKKVVFSLEASDSKGRIAEGEHVRFVVNAEMFMKNL